MFIGRLMNVICASRAVHAAAIAEHPEQGVCRT